MTRKYLDMTGLQTLWSDMCSKFAALASPAFTGTPTAPTAATGTDTTQIATTAFVQQEIDANAYELPTMSSSVKGGAKLGPGLSVDDDALSVDAEAIAGWGLEAQDGKLRVSDSLKLPVFDPSTGRYENASVKRWLDSGRDGLVYSVLIPRYSHSTSTACVKVDANAGLVCEPSTVATAGRDDYRHLGPFETWEVNGGADSDGSPFVTAFKDSDDAFDRHGGNGDVWMMRRVMWYRYEPTYSEQYARLSVCDTERDGFLLQPGAMMPDGTMRPYMLFSKYSGGIYDGKYASVSGAAACNRTVSHNSLITMASAKGGGYSGKSVSHDFIDKIDMLLIHASKSSQAVFAGCAGYTLQCAPTVAETGVKRVIVSNTNAASIDVGSWFMFGTHTGNNDRGMASNYDIFDGAKVLSKEAYDSSNTAVYFDVDTAFDTATTYLLSTAPWGSGSLDSVQGLDGTLTAAGRTNQHEPFLLRGRECMVGYYEILSGVILDAKEADGELLVEVNIAYDTADDATSLTADFTDTGVSLPTDEAAGWLYVTDFADAGGFLVPSGKGATSSTGMGDGHYQNVATSKGLREFLGLGALGSGGVAGLFGDGSGDWLVWAWWYGGSRLSATGRTAAPEEPQGDEEA